MTDLFNPWDSYIVADLDQGGMGVHLNRCGSCGALVASNDISTHADWHTTINAFAEDLKEVVTFIRDRG